MTLAYDPPRQKKPLETDLPLEIELVYNVRPCGTCDFFWPEKPADQSYGPYPIYDFTENYPQGNRPEGTPESYMWLKVKTRESGFPNGEVMDGCRKAPIMTIGINPNMTAFRPGKVGTAWAYPVFSSDDGTDGFAKYAYYYRYRNVYQEKFSFDDITHYLLSDSEVVADKSCVATADQVKAAADGHIVSAKREDAGPTFDLVIQYEGQAEQITITLQRDKGQTRYVLLFDTEEPDNKFKKGDVIAAKLNVPPDEELDLYQALQTYYEQFVPSLQIFNQYLHQKGHTDADLKIGEDVCQLDMVACASPHWKPGFLGGADSEAEIIDNCVSENAWAMKQLVQTRPAVLFLVGESSYTMFRKAFGNLIEIEGDDKQEWWEIHPSDFAFTLLRETTKNPVYLKYTTTVNGRPFTLKTRLIVTPHFSYDQNFTPQIRMSKEWFAKLKKQDPDCADFLEHYPEITANEDVDYGYLSFAFSQENAHEILTKIRDHFPNSWDEIKESYYNAHQMMANVMMQLFESGQLSYQDAGGHQAGYLSRGEGSCHFCVNDHWQFPLGCPYGKIEEEPPPPGFLNAVATEIAVKGKPTPKKRSS